MEVVHLTRNILADGHDEDAWHDARTVACEATTAMSRIAEADAVLGRGASGGLAAKRVLAPG